MDREIALRTLRAHEAELRSAGLSALYLFGSTARGEQREDSDVDLAFDVAPDTRFSLFDQARTQGRLMELLGREVDLIERASFRRHAARSFAQDMAQVF